MMMIAEEAYRHTVHVRGVNDTEYVSNESERLTVSRYSILTPPVSILATEIASLAAHVLSQPPRQ